MSWDKEFSNIHYTNIEQHAGKELLPQLTSGRLKSPSVIEV